MAPIRSMTVPAMTLAAWVSRSRAAFRAMVKLPRSGVGAAGGLGGVGDRDAQDLVAGQQGVDLLGDTGRGYGRLRKIVSTWKKSQASRPFA
jgi:hypothetical protein